MAVRNYADTAFPTTLTAAMTGGASATTSMSVASTSGLPAFPFTMLIDWTIPGSQEVVLVTSASGNTLTVTRNYDSAYLTTAIPAHASGAIVVHGVYAQDFTDAGNAASHTLFNSGVHGVSGNVVGTTDAQTLTNKTITSPAGLVKGDVGLGNVDNTSDATKNAATATLTNKTLTSPTITTPSISNPSFTNTKMAILYRAGAAQILNWKSGTTIGLDTAAYDPFNGFTPGTNTFTFPVGGFWQISSVVRFQSFSGVSGSTDVQTGYSVNGNASWYGNVRSIVAATGNVIAIAGTDTVQVSAGDTVVLRAYFSAGGTTALTCSLDVAAPYWPRMSLTYLSS